jgi:hypothetical protein
MTVYSMVVGHLVRKTIGCGLGLGQEAVMNGTSWIQQIAKSTLR